MVKYVAGKIWLINVEKLSKLGRYKISCVKKPGFFFPNHTIQRGYKQ